MHAQATLPAPTPACAAWRAPPRHPPASLPCAKRATPSRSRRCAVSTLLEPKWRRVASRLTCYGRRGQGHGAGNRHAGRKAPLGDGLSLQGRKADADRLHASFGYQTPSETHAPPVCCPVHQMSSTAPPHLCGPSPTCAWCAASSGLFSNSKSSDTWLCSSPSSGLRACGSGCGYG